MTDLVRSQRKEIVHSIVHPYLTSKKDRSLLSQYERVSPAPDGRNRTVLSPVVTETGRLASGESFVDPHSTNWQNISKTEGFRDDLYRVRDVVIPDDGMVLLASDLDKAEAIVAAFESQDWDFYEKLIAGEDTHTWIASLAFHDGNTKAVTKHERQGSKNTYYACVPTDTEILTTEGWKSHEDIAAGEPIVGYDPDTDELVNDVVTAVNLYNSAPLKRYSHSRFSVVCTENHKWAMKNRNTGKVVKEPIVAGQGARDFIVSAPYEGGEGIVLGRKGFGSVTEQQVLNMTPEQRQAFLLGVVTGEGNQRPNRYGPWFAQSTKKWADQYALALFLEGFNARVIPKTTNPSVCEIFGNKPTQGTVMMTEEDVPSAPVWCPTTGTGYWVARQGGQMFITGNSLYMAGVPTITRTINKYSDQLGFKITEAEVGVIRDTIMEVTRLEEWWSEVWDDLMNPDTHGGTRWLENCLQMRRKFYNPDHHKLHKEAVNFFPQSTVASKIDEVLIAWWRDLEEPGRAEILLQIHDELLVQVREDDLHYYAGALHSLMKAPFTSQGREVHIPAGLEAGYRWEAYRSSSNEPNDPDNSLGRMTSLSL